MSVWALRPRRAVLAVELAVALSLLGVLTVLTAKAIAGHLKARDCHTWRLAAAWAAEGQLQRYQCGAAFDSLPPKGVLPPEITLHTEVQPGTGQWEGFMLVTVTAEVRRRHAGTLLERAACYIPDEVQR